MLEMLGSLLVSLGQEDTENFIWSEESELVHLTGDAKAGHSVVHKFLAVLYNVYVFYELLVRACIKALMEISIEELVLTSPSFRVALIGLFLWLLVPMMVKILARSYVISIAVQEEGGRTFYNYYRISWYSWNIRLIDTYLPVILEKRYGPHVQLLMPRNWHLLDLIFVGDTLQHPICFEECLSKTGDTVGGIYNLPMEIRRLWRNDYFHVLNVLYLFIREKKFKKEERELLSLLVRFLV